MNASADQGHERSMRRVRDRSIAAAVMAGVIRNWLTHPGRPHSHLLTNVWIELKRYGAPRVRNVELSQLRGIDRVRVAGPVRRHSPLVLTALAMLLECETVFELGPDTGDAAALLAHNLPHARIFLLDDDGDRPRQPDTGRITHLSGDSFTTDLLPYSGTIDLVYIEGSGRYSHLGSDTEAAFGLLSELGSIVWDGYAGDPGVYAYLNQLEPTLDRPVFHLLGTRLALYSRWDILVDER